MRTRAAERRDGEAVEGWRPAAGSGLRQAVESALLAVLIASPLLGYGAWRLHADWSVRERARVAAIEAALAHERLVAGPAGPGLDAALASRGRDLFVATCAACHGAAGTGAAGLGKDLTQSDFVAALDDTGLVAFLETGRPDARPIGMPPKGGRADLTSEDLGALVAFVRGLQDPRRMPELAAAQAASVSVSAADVESALEAAGGDAELAGWIASGSKLFAATCAACHGADARGVKGNGKDLVASAMFDELDDEGMLAFVLRGRDPGDPASTTGVSMPPRGGNPALSEDDILDVIAYLRSLRAGGAKGARASQ